MTGKKEITGKKERRNDVKERKDGKERRKKEMTGKKERKKERKKDFWINGERKKEIKKWRLKERKKERKERKKERLLNKWWNENRKSIKKKKEFDFQLSRYMTQGRFIGARLAQIETHAWLDQKKKCLVPIGISLFGRLRRQPINSTPKGFIALLTGKKIEKVQKEKWGQWR